MSMPLEMNGIELARHSALENTTYSADITIIDWNEPDDPQDPFNWPLWKKWWATGLSLLESFVCSMNGTILSVAHQDISEEFHISDAKFPHFYWLTTSWGLGAALCPLAIFPIMEDFGVRPMLLGTYFVFACLLVPVGFAHNYATLTVVRFISGGCVPLMSDAVASIASNVFHGDQARSIPISLYVTVYLASTSIGLVVGASILQSLPWRWIGYMETIWTAALLPMLALGLLESRGSAILHKAKSLRSDGKNAYTAAELELDGTPWYKLVINSMKRPFYMLLSELVVFFAALWAAFILGTIYLFTQSIEQVYAELYGWHAVKAGYVQSTIVIGEILSCYNSAAWNVEIPGVPIPEARLYSSIIGGFVGVTGGMLVYGWASCPSINWMAPTFGLAMVGFRTTAVIIANANYLIDAYSKYAASALGAVGLVENVAIAFLPLATRDMYANLGFHWASSVLAFVSLALAATPLVMLRWGAVIRSRSLFMREAIIDRRRGAVDTASICDGCL
ncbi:MFS general substrate transporter [Aspergillus bertholletiae]|uniref:MFS general substrate transporter n=1 Tax=Aspergillus bertholletiae TaxID=1226010 RepID=A0A5N7AT21_9EURO|nr:MFS general substrate transporter [Aspergillus bertholletiae]